MQKVLSLIRNVIYASLIQQRTETNLPSINCKDYLPNVSRTDKFLFLGKTNSAKV